MQNSHKNIQNNFSLQIKLQKRSLNHELTLKESNKYKNLLQQYQKSGLNKQTKNINSKISIYTIIIYLLLIFYLIDVFIFMVPVLLKGIVIKSAVIVYGVIYCISMILMMISYEKARKSSPGYVAFSLTEYSINTCKQNKQLHKVQHQIQALKNHTMQLLIKKTQLTQKSKQNPNDQKLLKQLQQFQLIFYSSQLKYCQKCLSIKLPRFRHCSQCNSCIQRMDHHCVWLNNCVGKQNHKFFLLFLMYLLGGLFMIWVMALLDHVVYANQIFRGIVKNNGKIFALVYESLAVLAFILWVYHIFVLFQQIHLISKNITFVQSLSNTLNTKMPWKKQGLLNNFYEVLGQGCWLLPTSPKFINYNDRKQKQKINSGTINELVEQIEYDHPKENKEKKYQIHQSANQFNKKQQYEL